MEAKAGKSTQKKDGGKEFSKLITEIRNDTWHKDISIIDFSGNCKTIGTHVKFPENLLELKLSHNDYIEVPESVMKLGNLKKLDLSHNLIEFFDMTPNFCHTIEWLDISTNCLQTLPYWIWAETPQNLVKVVLSCNAQITRLCFNSYIRDLLHYNTLVSEIDLSYCGFKAKHTALLATFSNAKSINFGTSDYYYEIPNKNFKFPNKGFEQCTHVEQLNLSNTMLCKIDNSIDLLKNLRVLNLQYNYIRTLPNEFCSLINMEICVLSDNDIVSLPEGMHNLTKLTKLSLASNQLCELPKNLLELENLKALDLYDNRFYGAPKGYVKLEEFDLALNHMEEPTDAVYLERKEKLRQLHENRLHGRKPDRFVLDTLHDALHDSLKLLSEKYHPEYYNGKIPPPEFPIVERDQSVRPLPLEDWNAVADDRFTHILQRFVEGLDVSKLELEETPECQNPAEVEYYKKLFAEDDMARPDCVLFPDSKFKELFGSIFEELDLESDSD